MTQPLRKGFQKWSDIVRDLKVCWAVGPLKIRLSLAKILGMCPLSFLFSRILSAGGGRDCGGGGPGQRVNAWETDTVLSNPSYRELTTPPAEQRACVESWRCAQGAVRRGVGKPNRQLRIRNVGSQGLNRFPAVVGAIDTQHDLHALVWTEPQLPNQKKLNAVATTGVLP